MARQPGDDATFVFVCLALCSSFCSGVFATFGLGVLPGLAFAIAMGLATAFTSRAPSCNHFMAALTIWLVWLAVAGSVVVGMSALNFLSFSVRSVLVGSVVGGIGAWAVLRCVGASTGRVADPRYSSIIGACCGFVWFLAESRVDGHALLVIVVRVIGFACWQVAIALALASNSEERLGTTTTQSDRHVHRDRVWCRE